MRFVNYWRPEEEEEGAHRAEYELTDTSAFIEAQLRTGLLLEAWGDQPGIIPDRNQTVPPIVAPG